MTGQAISLLRRLVPSFFLGRPSDRENVDDESGLSRFVAHLPQPERVLRGRLRLSGIEELQHAS
jgi:hypothetical protein